MKRRVSSLLTGPRRFSTKNIPVNGISACFASAEDLLIRKLFAGRPRDLEDAKGILRKNPRLDISYVRKQLGEFSEVLGEDFVSRLDALD